MEKQAASRKTKKIHRPDGLKPKAIKWKKKLQVEKQKNPSKPAPDG